MVYERTPSHWSADVPDLPGCVAAGDTREKTARLIREAILLHIEGRREDGEPVPEPGTWADLVEVRVPFQR